MNNSNIKVIISWILLSTAFFALSNSLETEEHLDVINQHPGCQERKCQIAEVRYLKRHKRSAEMINFNVEYIIGGKSIILHLKASNGIMVDSKTPVYYVTSDKKGRNTIEKRVNIFNLDLRGMHFIDEEKKAAAAVTVDPITQVQTIKTVFIGTENLVVDHTTANNKSYHIARTVPNSNVDILGVGLNLRHVANSSSEIPETIYPEVLVIVDYQYYKYFKDQLMGYILQFWNAVDLYYRPLRNPQYKLSIAGVVVAKDENVFPLGSPSTWGTKNRIPYNSSMDYTTEWLKNATKVIPFSSYDTHIYMTPYRDGLVTQATTLGISYVSSACDGVTESISKGGIVSDPYNLERILTAVHELGHIFGANHDESGSCASVHSIMWPISEPERELWSKCSIESFRSNLRNRNFTCMYNKPFPAENPSTIYFRMHVVDPYYYYYGPPTLFHHEISDDKYQLTVSFAQFLPNREIMVYYMNKTLVITQLHNKVTPSWTDPNASRGDLQGRFPDDKIIKFDSSLMNPSKVVNIYHENRYIYIYQGNKPTGNTSESQQSNNNNQGPDLYSTSDQLPLCFQRSHFKLHKVVKIYYRNNVLYVSQSNVPNNPFLNPSYGYPYIQQTVLDTQSITIFPTLISPSMIVCISHANGLIFIQGRNMQPVF